MTRSSAGPQIRLEHLGVAIMVLTILVLPALQFLTGVFSPGWDIASYVILGIGIVALTLVPWLQVRPLRKALAERLSEGKDVFNSFAALWQPDFGRLKPMALVGNRAGLELFTADSISYHLAWSDIVDIREVYSTATQPDMILIAAADTSDSLNLIPLSSSGMYKLKVHLIAGRVAELRAMRNRLGSPAAPNSTRDIDDQSDLRPGL